MFTVRYRHLDIPTLERRPGEAYLASQKMFVSGAGTSPYGIQWTRYEGEAHYPELVRSVPHVAFEVSDLAAALSGRNVLVRAFDDAPGVIAAFIEDNGAPIKLLQIDGAGTPVPTAGTASRQPPKGLQYNSCWIPAKDKPNGKQELHLADLRMYVVPHDHGLYRVGWVRYQEDAPYPPIVGQLPHLAFEVDDIAEAIAGKKVIIKPNCPTPGLVVAFIEDDGAPIEFLEIDRTILKDGI